MPRCPNNKYVDFEWRFVMRAGKSRLELGRLGVGSLSQHLSNSQGLSRFGMMNALLRSLATPRKLISHPRLSCSRICTHPPPRTYSTTSSLSSLFSFASSSKATPEVDMSAKQLVDVSTTFFRRISVSGADLLTL